MDDAIEARKAPIEAVHANQDGYSCRPSRRIVECQKNTASEYQERLRDLGEKMLKEAGDESEQVDTLVCEEPHPRLVDKAGIEEWNSLEDKQRRNKARGGPDADGSSPAQECTHVGKESTASMRRHPRNPDVLAANIWKAGGKLTQRDGCAKADKRHGEEAIEEQHRAAV
ncbi:unnamed protein product [Clonostachys rhizophaga]|uniref:Uncharacterized protein n=1 Tax=Clonostachys rhizophaga TaxID=160324 RepID=A0A9N9V9I9_9HYPO|nr:unnamed protein product [Clonostachys rhizophaga]